MSFSVPHFRISGLQIAVRTYHNRHYDTVCTGDGHTLTENQWQYRVLLASETRSLALSFSSLLDSSRSKPAALGTDLWSPRWTLWRQETPRGTTLEGGEDGLGTIIILSLSKTWERDNGQQGSKSDKPEDQERPSKKEVLNLRKAFNSNRG